MREDGRRSLGARRADLVLGLSLSPGRATAAQSEVMLARILPSGVFQLLTGGWAHALGYAPHDLIGKVLRDLMQLESAREVVTALLDASDDRPLDVTLRCKDGRCKSFRLHRRFDPYDGVVFVLAVERVETPPGKPTLNRRTIGGP